MKWINPRDKLPADIKDYKIVLSGGKVNSSHICKDKCCEDPLEEVR